MSEEHPTQRIVCSNPDCGHVFEHTPGRRPDPALRGTPCPDCGSTAKTYGLTSTAVLEVTAAMSYVATKRFWERNWWLLAVVVLLALVPPALGFLLAPWVSAVVSIGCSVLSFLVGILALTRVREIMREQG